MLSKTTVLQNWASPVTDDAANKVIELHVAGLVSSKCWREYSVQPMRHQ